MNKFNLKIFKDKNKNLSLKDIDPHMAYYQYIKDENELGYEQFLITSDLMLNFITNMLTNNDDIYVSDIKLYNPKINPQLLIDTFNNFHTNHINKDIFKFTLMSIVNNYNIDIDYIIFHDELTRDLIIKNNGNVYTNKPSWKSSIIISMINAWNQ